MKTAITRAARPGLSGIRMGGWGGFALLAAAVALVAGCAASSSVSASPSQPAVSASATAKATPVPTITGGTGVSCAGWPTGTASALLPLSFVPVSVERCVEGYQTVPGKGVWLTATLERADTGLAALINALREPSVGGQTDHLCPAIATVPQVIVLIGTTGQKLSYRLPSAGCAFTSSKVSVALDALPWQQVSVHLISQSPDYSNGPGGTVKGLSTFG